MTRLAPTEGGGGGGGSAASTTSSSSSSASTPASTAAPTPSSSNPAGPAQTVSGGVGAAASVDELTADKEKIVNDANALVEQSHKEWKTLSNKMDKKSYNGSTLADDMLKNMLLIRDLKAYFEAKKLYSKHKEISQEAQALNPKNPGEFARNVSGVSKRLHDAKNEYKKIQEDRNFQQNASYSERFMRYVGPNPQKDEQKKARQDVTQEPSPQGPSSQGPRR